MALEINHTSQSTVPDSPVYGGVIPQFEDGPYFPKYEGFEVLPSSDVRWSHWELDKGMDIKRTASDFYLLYDLYIDELDNGHFEELMKYVLPQFVKYTDMAVGGELRHARNMVKANMRIPAPLRVALKWKAIHEKPQFGISTDRHEAWKQWKYFRRHFGNVSLLWAEKTFPLFRHGAFGGPRWANIAKTLRKFVTGEYTPIMFIDTCWGLQHNGGSYFNKAWSTNGIKDVLDANQRGDYSKLCNYASPAVAEFYKQARNDS